MLSKKLPGKAASEGDASVSDMRADKLPIACLVLYFFWRFAVKSIPGAPRRSHA